MNRASTKQDSTKQARGNRASFMTATSVFTGRAITRQVRTPETIVQTVIFPISLLLTLLAVFSSSVEAFGEDGAYAQRLVPGMIMAGVMFGSVGSAAGLFTDLQGGFMQRIRSLAAPLSAPIIGTVLAEALRGLVAVAALVGTGVLAGFRFQGSVGDTLMFCAIAALGGLTFPWFGMWLATRVKTLEALIASVSALFLMLLFLSQSMVPLAAYPEFVQPVVEWNPASAFVVALDKLGRGENATSEVALAVGWSVVLIAGFCALAVRGLNRRQGVN